MKIIFLNLRMSRLIHYRLPLNNGYKDWDCADALCLSDLIQNLGYIRQNGTLAPNIRGQKCQDSVSPILENVLATLKTKVADWSAEGQPGHLLHTMNICLFDGFLIYSQSTSVLWPFLDLKIFLQTSQLAVKARREVCGGYNSDENFWQDPPDYVSTIVWPNYCRDHRWLFENGDVEGKILGRYSDLGEIKWQGRADIDIEASLIWAVELLMNELPGLLKAVK